MSDYYALITGSSQGIGRAYAMELAARNHNILLVALPDAKLEETRMQITNKFNVKVDSLPIDLSTADAPQKVYDWWQSK